ncbi:Zn-ribbon domain-containing OB-fold protein [Aquabacter sp. CN5-332]|uniref:Zn-ribbon domain-containing OB-fold protein n=1 Tax=Aquabacter sp. CN5-332 TaxID=3156608 RepID=UPI0032B572DA
MNEELPLPIINADSGSYWGGANEGRLMIRACKACGAKHFMPRNLCPHCWSEDLEWVEASGHGTVHSFTVIRRAPLASYAGRVPYVVALVELHEGPRMLTNIVGEDALATCIGDAVEVCFERRGEQAIPQFTRV